MASGKEIQVRFRVSNLSIVGRKSIRCTVRMDEQREGERERGEAGSSATIDLLIIRQLLTVFPRELRKYIASFRENRTTRSLLRICDTSMLLQKILETH